MSTEVAKKSEKKKKKDATADLSPERQIELREMLMVDILTGARIGLAGIVLVCLVLYYILIVGIELSENLEFFSYPILFLALTSTIYLSFVHKRIPNYLIRMSLISFGVVAMGALIGFGLFYYIKAASHLMNLASDPSATLDRAVDFKSLTAFIGICVVIAGGMLGAGSALFGASKWLFRTFSLVLALPTALYLLVGQAELDWGYFGIGAFFFLLLIILWIVNRIDFNRRREVILLQFGLRDEKERTEKNLAKVQALKNQQDGDYFLTSLLIEPLSVNEAKSKHVKVDFLTKEKKTFTFRKWKRELGGDINISHNLWIGDKRYTVFLNADAMGKSIQGAGGSLVLGTVFQSIILRMQENRNQVQHPEDWLKNTFSELQTIFESFDGSMLVSLVFGLVDEESGFCYYINAEHPFTVLYRDKKASFIDEELKLRKLGTIGLSPAISVETIQLQPGDVLIAGTDGRDDILFGINEGVRDINEDENEFLKRVEEGDGRLDDIYKALVKQGELTDDIALLRVEYIGIQGESKKEFNKVFLQLMDKTREAKNAGKHDEAIELLHEALELEPTVASVLAQLSRLYFQKKDYKQAADFALRFLAVNPGENKYIYLASYCFKKLGEFEKGAELGERLFLREPKNVDNLVNLIGIYIKQQHWARAREVLDHGLEISPEDKEIHKLKSFLEEAGRV